MKTRLVAIASYCGEDNDDCSNSRPCSYCLDMCNVFEMDFKTKEVNYLCEYKELKEKQQ